MNTPYERWYLLKRKRARLAKQQPPAPSSGTYASTFALYTGNF